MVRFLILLFSLFVPLSTGFSAGTEISFVGSIRIKKSIEPRPLSVQSAQSLMHGIRPQSSSVQQSSIPVPPPWSFHASHIHYQFRWIRADQARRYCPIDQNNVHLLSFLGYTLGGIFCVDYTQSPIGPYREIAILSGLLLPTKPKTWLSWPAIPFGAWASHIFVDSTDAAQYGRQHWGLPAQVVPKIRGMDVSDISTPDNRSHDKAATVSLVFSLGSEPKIWVGGWTASTTNTFVNDFNRLGLGWVDVTLPSLSGCLPISVETKDSSISKPSIKTPLLEYPLRIRKPESIRFTAKEELQLSFQSEQQEISMGNNFRDSDYSFNEIKSSFQDIEELLHGSIPICSLLINNVELEAGIAKEV